MLDKASVCLMMIPKGTKLPDLFVRGIKRFIEKLEEYRCVQLVNITLTTVNISPHGFA